MSGCNHKQWLTTGNYLIDTNNTKTNRCQLIREVYQPHNLDIASEYVKETAKTGKTRAKILKKA